VNEVTLVLNPIVENI